MFKKYYYLTKPGIIRGNLLAAGAGFLLAAQGTINLWLLLATLIGTSLVIASACVVNNIVDRSIDAKMERTQKRSLVRGTISVQQAIIFAVVLGLMGFATLIAYVNIPTALIGLLGYAAYVVLYGIGKRKTVHGTLIGTISGSTPPAAGYVAVTGSVDLAAILLFLVMVCWQMPHFYAIAMYRLKDYQAAGLPVLPAVKGMRATKIQIVGYAVGFVLSAALLTILDYTGVVYLVVSLAAGGIWVLLGIQGFRNTDDVRWAKKMFFFSLLVLLVWCGALSVDAWLP